MGAWALCVNTVGAICAACGKEKKRFASSGRIASRCHHCGRRPCQVASAALRATKTNCECCGGSFENKTTGLLRVLCADCTIKRKAQVASVVAKARRSARAKTVRHFSCSRCGRQFAATRKLKYCGAKCRELAGRESNWRESECLWCKKKFTAKTKKAKCCSNNCAQNARHNGTDDSKRTRWGRTCIGCGAAFMMKNGTRRKGLYCTRECAFAHGRMSPERAVKRKDEARIKLIMMASEAMAEGAATWMHGWRQCDWCNASFWSRGSGTTCGSGCWRHAKQGATRPCELCGQEIDRRSELGRRQCKACRVSVMKARRDRLDIQRRTRRETQWVEHVSRSVVFRRDRYQCWICLGMVKRKYDSNDPASPTIDHVVPLAKGGSHSYANCRTAHAICNSLKSDDI